MIGQCCSSDVRVSFTNHEMCACGYFRRMIDRRQRLDNVPERTGFENENPHRARAYDVSALL